MTTPFVLRALRSAFFAVCFGVPLVVTAVACTGGPGTLGDDGASGGAKSGDSTSSPGSSSPGSSSPGRPSPGTGSDSEESADGQPIDTAGVTQIAVAQAYCGGAPGKCYDRSTYEVDFASSSLTVTTCVEEDGGITMSPTQKALTPAQLQSVRDALGQLRTRSADNLSYDGRMDALSVTSTAGTKKYSNEPTCNHAAYELIGEGWPALMATVRAL